MNLIAGTDCHHSGLLDSSDGLNSTRGFFPRGFFPSSALEVLPCKVSAVSTTTLKERLIIISNKGIDTNINQPQSNKDLKKDGLNFGSENKRQRKPKRKKPRKWATHNEDFEHNGATYKINVASSGVLSLMMHPIIQQLDVCQHKWKRVFCYMFNLHQKGNFTPDNEHLTKFFKNLNRRLQRAYNIKHIGYVWAREQERSKSQHYHCAIFLDGDLVRRASNKLKGIVRGAWCALHESHSVWFVDKAGYFIDNEKTKLDCVYRLSYLAKSRGKGYREDQVKDYSTSRLIAPQSKD